MRRLAFLDDGDVAPAAPVVAEVVAGAGVVLLPTETYYGLAADPLDPRAVTRVFVAKGRPAAMSLPVLCSDWGQVESLVEVPETYRVRLSRIWPGALSVVLRCRRPVAAATAGTLAVRIPGHPMLRALLYRVGPLTGTSANRHGDPACADPDAALESLVEPPELVLDGGRTPGGVPSTLVDLTAEEPRVLRPGPVPWDQRYPWDELG